jgi:S-adenosylmethionine decarboxylase
MVLATEVLMDAWGCSPASLVDQAVLWRTCNTLIARAERHVVGTPQWHRFADTVAGPGGVTGLVLLSESHLAVHTWPEHGAALLSLCSCRPPLADVVVKSILADHLGATDVRVSRVARGRP